MHNSRILYYVKRFTEIYDGTPWFGDSLIAQLAVINSSNALIKPHGLHSIAEIISHITYWRKSLINKLENSDLPNPSMKSEENWTTIETLEKIGWDAIRYNFDQSQQKIVSMLATRDDDFLAEAYRDKITMKQLVRGTIDHDIYHIGQIGIIKKLI